MCKRHLHQATGVSKNDLHHIIDQGQKIPLGIKTSSPAPFLLFQKRKKKSYFYVQGSTRIAYNRWNYNLGHIILELYNVLIQIRLTTSKTKRDIWYSKLGIRVVSRVAERRKT